MPIALVRSISLPSLKIYTAFSLLLVSGCIYYAFDVVRTDPHWKLHQNTTHPRAASLLKSSNAAIAALTNSDLLSSLASSLSSKDKEEVERTAEEQPENVYTGEILNENSSFTHQLRDVVSFMTHEPVCIWVRIALAFIIFCTLRLTHIKCYQMCSFMELIRLSASIITADYVTLVKISVLKFRNVLA